MTLAYNSERDKAQGTSFTLFFFSEAKEGVIELVRGYELSSSSSESSKSSSSRSSSTPSLSLLSESSLSSSSSSITLF